MADHCAFTGLLVLTKGVQLSGYLHHLGERLIAAMPTERALALFLVLAAALLSTLLTNDVALFVMVPLTSSLRAMSAVPVTRLIVFEALAVNAGSALTPLRNPQNLFLWQLSHTSFRQYVAAMLPLAIILLIPLLLLTAWTFSGSSIPIKGDNHQPPRRNGLLYLSLALYLPFLVLADRHHAELAVTLVVAILRAQAMPALPKVTAAHQRESADRPWVMVVLKETQVPRRNTRAYGTRSASFNLNRGRLVTRRMAWPKSPHRTCSPHIVSPA